MNPSEYYEFEDRAYVNPTLSRDEQLGFVDNLRDIVRNDTAQINTQTQRLGKNIAPNFGGLGGSNNYFTQRYQTMPIQSQVNTLKAAAQSKALNDLLTNYQNQAANRYNQAYRAYNRRTGGTGGSGGSGGNGNNNNNNNNGNNPTWDGDTEKNIKDPQYIDTYQIPYKNQVRVYTDLSATVDDATAAKLGTGYNGQITTYGGAQYVWANGANGPRWYKVKIISPISGGN